jgi:LacI family transcriptional regulator
LATNIQVYDALRQCREANVPVITLVTDLPGAQRLCHVGIDQQQAGRTAGGMMGLMAHRGEVLMLSGRRTSALIACGFRDFAR